MYRKKMLDASVIYFKVLMDFKIRPENKIA